MGSIYKRGSIWWLKYYRGGRPMRESSGQVKESDAKRLLKLREGDIVRGVPVTPKIGRVTFNELAEDEINDYKMNGRRSIGNVERRLKKHLLPFFGGRRASLITTADVRAFITARQTDGASNGEINRELTALKRAFSLGAQAGKIMVKPHIPMLQENNVRVGFFERVQFENVRYHLPEALRAAITMAYITGWRITSEILSLQWRQVDFQAGRVVLEAGTTKNDAARVFPFTSELRALLQAQRAKTQALQRERGALCPWVFHRDGKQIRSFRRSWKTACKNAGLPGRIPHDFRRTAVRNLVRAGIPERVAMQMTGHKTRSVFERYNIVSEGDLSDAARRLDEFSSVTGTVTGTVGHSEGKAEMVNY